MSRENGKYPSTIYRVSLKAIIRNDKGEVLLVQEGADDWTFPGGGIEHGETETEALRRELMEEASITASFTANPIGIETIFIEYHDTWIIWMLYEVNLDNGFAYAVTNEVRDVQFIDPVRFKNSNNDWERFIYKWAHKKSPR